MEAFASIKLQRMPVSARWASRASIVKRKLKYATTRHAKTALYVLWRKGRPCVIAFQIFTVKNANISTTSVRSDQGELEAIKSALVPLLTNLHSLHVAFLQMLERRQMR